MVTLLEIGDTAVRKPRESSKSKRQRLHRAMMGEKESWIGRQKQGLMF